MTNDYTTNMGSERTISNSGHFADYEFVPAVIENVKDPLNYGRVQVSAPGVFNANNSDTSQLPWCYPFTMFGAQGHISYDRGSKVWLIRNKKRQDENWFIPMYELHDEEQKYVNDNRDAEPQIVLHKNNGGKSSVITSDTSNGITMSTGNAGVNVSSSNTVTVSGGGSGITVNDTKVTLGSGGAESGSGEPAVLGNKYKDFLRKALANINNALQKMQDKIPEIQGDVDILSNINTVKSMINDNQIEDTLSKTVEIAEEGGGDSAQESEGGSSGETNASGSIDSNTTGDSTTGDSKANPATAKQKLAADLDLTEAEYNTLNYFDQQAYIRRLQAKEWQKQQSDNLAHLKKIAPKNFGDEDLEFGGGKFGGGGGGSVW